LRVQLVMKNHASMAIRSDLYVRFQFILCGGGHS